ncbi:MAG: hypothetical protein ACYCYO_09205 [Bacilli bacterium]
MLTIMPIWGSMRGHILRRSCNFRGSILDDHVSTLQEGLFKYKIGEAPQPLVAVRESLVAACDPLGSRWLAASRPSE